MTSEAVADGVGYIAGALIVVGYVPQLVQIVKTRSTKDVSLHTYVLLILAQILWVVYGILKADARIIVTNVISCTIAICVLFYSMYLRKTQVCE